MNKFTTIIMGAGIGKRMNSKVPKIIHKILGKPIISFVIDRVKDINCPEVIVVVGKHEKLIKAELGRTVGYALQPIPLGTGDAAKKGIAKATHNNILILNGDIPLISEKTIGSLISHHKHEKADLTILTCIMKNPSGYGRVLRDKDNRISGIIEQIDATAKQQQIKEINVGAYYGNKKIILAALNMIKPQNNQGELYLTDIVKNLLENKRRVIGFKTNDEEEMMGINTKTDLARARRIIKERRFDRLMKKG
jgi:bifunctional UDP-N-acetylglucosamine pyrophosphorylase/glucosamine-1-phosphate N-acetyltransferase